MEVRLFIACVRFVSVRSVRTATNIAIEYRYAEGKADRLPALAAELVGFKVDVIVAAATPNVLAVTSRRN